MAAQYTDRDTETATNDTAAILSSRRSILKNAAIAGLAVTGAGVLTGKAAHAAATADDRPSFDPTADHAIFTVARTAEQLAITFYTNGVKNAAALGITGDNLVYLKAALIEEQIHQIFFRTHGGASLAATFSFPDPKTFTDLQTFIATQQTLEGAFDSAFLAAVKEFAQLGEPRHAQIAAQIAMVESEHRVLGRVIAGLSPADNWTYAPVLVHKVADAPGVLAGAGFLSPEKYPNNSYTYQEVTFTDPANDPLGLSAIAATIMYKDVPYTVSNDLIIQGD